MNKKKEVVFSGVSISGGVAIGSAFFLFEEIQNIPDTNLSDVEVDLEIQKYRGALTKSRKDLKYLQSRYMKEGILAVVDILDAQLEILHDPVIIEIVEKRIRQTNKNTEFVFNQMLKEYKKAFSNVQDEVFKERIKDVQDVSWRIFKHLRPVKKNRMELQKTSIIVAIDLIPSDTFEISEKNVLAFVTQKGGYASHAGIIARAKEIPFVAKIDVEKLKSIDPELIIVDGEKGKIIANPSNHTLKNYKITQQKLNKYYFKIKEKSFLEAKTKDGKKIDIFSNVESLKDINFILKNKFEGIGLFRSEYLFLTENFFPTEEKQFQIYTHLAQKLEEKPVVIRLFDIGADKDQFFNKNFRFEANPVLGCRAIRFLMKNKRLLEKQIRAILKASSYGNIHMMIPLVSDISEVIYVKQMIRRISKELKKKNIRIKEKIPLGIMIEVPSCALMADVFLKEVDFCSIGTNDLIQYIMAADRSNPDISHLFDFAHPSIFKLIQMIESSCRKYKKSLSICGEMGADVRFVEVLIGLGIFKFSISPRHMAKIKDAILKIEMKKAVIKAKRILEAKGYHDIKRIISG